MSLTPGAGSQLEIGQSGICHRLVEIIIKDTSVMTFLSQEIMNLNCENTKVRHTGFSQELAVDPSSLEGTAEMDFQ